MDITIVIPVYNRRGLIKRTLQSILHSPYGSVPLIVVDNGSTDGTLDILQEYSAAYPFISIAHEPQRNAAAARNKGLSLVKTTWVYFFDSDDEFEDLPHYWNSDVDMVAFPTRQKVEGKISVRTYRESADPAVHILNGMLNTISMIFRATWLKEIGGWNTNCRIWDDWELGARALMSVPRLQWITDKPYHTINVHSDSLTGPTFKSRYKLQLDAIKEVLDDAGRTDENICDRCHKALMLRTYILSGKLLYEGDRKASAECRQFIDEKFGKKPSGSILGKFLEQYTALGLHGAWRIALRYVTNSKYDEDSADR